MGEQDVNTVPTEAMARNAERGLDLVLRVLEAEHEADAVAQVVAQLLRDPRALEAGRVAEARGGRLALPLEELLEAAAAGFRDTAGFEQLLEGQREAAAGEHGHEALRRAPQREGILRAARDEPHPEAADQRVEPVEDRQQRAFEARGELVALEVREVVLLDGPGGGLGVAALLAEVGLWVVSDAGRRSGSRNSRGPRRPSEVFLSARAGADSIGRGSTSQIVLV